MGERRPGPNLSPMSVFETPVTGPIDKYVFLADRHLRLISVFDDTSYDRADADLLSPPMRQHLAKLLAKNGFKQSSGTVFKNKALNVKCIIPKAHALGASPFDVTRFTPRGDNDFYVLTPTQTACFFIDNYGLQDAFDRVVRSEEHTSELQSRPHISYAVFCLKKKKNHIKYVQKAGLH